MATRKASKVSKVSSPVDASWSTIGCVLPTGSAVTICRTEELAAGVAKFAALYKVAPTAVRIEAGFFTFTL